MKIRSYTELIKLKSFEERYLYLKLESEIGDRTFGFDRWVNQRFYNSVLWKRVRDEVLIRDDGLDLGIYGRNIISRPMIHHMNPMRLRDVTHFNPEILNPEFLITASRFTHSAIHFGDEHLAPEFPVTRVPGDTKLW